MSRFARVYEDPDYEDWADSLESDEGDWVEDGNKEFQSIWTPLESLKDALLIQKELFI